MYARTLAAVVMLALACHARAGSIDYAFHSQLFPDGTIASLQVDDAALSRGVFTNADVLRFFFQPFATPDLPTLSIGITPDGVPTEDVRLAGSRVIDRIRYSYTLDFGPSDFGPPARGFYQVSGGGTPGIYGYGFWTSAIHADLPPSGSAAVPEPPSSFLAVVGLAMVGAVVAMRRRVH